MTAAPRVELVRRLVSELVPGASGGATLALLGVGGIGKSTLLAEVVDAVTSAGVRVVGSRASDRTEREPFASVRFLFVGAPADPAAAALATVDAWCSQGPVLLWVDDAHHLDASSTSVLSRLARASRDLPLTLLVSARPHLRNPELARLLELCSTRIDVGPLCEQELVELVRQKLAGIPGPRLLAELAVAGGNPFAVEMLVGLLEHRGALARQGDVVELDGSGSAVPESTAAVVRSFLAQFPDETREVLAVIAVLGTPALPEDVAALAERPLVSLGAPLAEAVDAGVLRWDEDHLVFRHDLFAEVIQQELPQALRTALHRKAVTVLQARGAPLQQVAEHAWRGGNREDVPLLRSVAADLDVYAPGVAADLLGHVQPLISAEETDEMVADRAESLVRAGRGRDAEDLISAYLPRATSPAQVERLHDLALTSMIHRANTAGVQAQIDNLLMSGGLTAEMRMELVGLRGWVLMLDGHLSAAEEIDRQLDQLRAAGEPPSALSMVLAWLHGRPQDALRMQEASRAVDAERNAAEATPVFPPLYVLYGQGPEAAERVNAEERALSLAYDFSYVETFHDFVLGNIYLVAGRWDDANAAMDAGIENAEETGSMGQSAPLGGLALMDAHRGRIEQARSRLELVVKNRYPPQMGRDYAALAAVYIAEAEAVSSISASSTTPEWEKAFAPAARAARDLWDAAVARGGELWMYTIAGYVVRIGDDDLRRSVVDVLRGARTGQMPVLDPVRDQVLGMWNRDHAAVAVAAERFAAASHPLAAGFAWEEAGLLAARQGVSGAATKALRGAITVYQGLGASSDLERARARAQRLGIRRTQPRAASQPKTGWEALTPTENTVAGLVRQGLTNPEIARRLFLSPRTVQTHVSHILQKTQLSSRVEIAALLV